MYRVKHSRGNDARHRCEWRDGMTLRRAVASDPCMARKESTHERWRSPKKVTICPSGSDGTILGFVAVTGSDCLASLWISITEKTTLVHRQLHDDYTTFSCAWVRHRRMRDCLENRTPECRGRYRNRGRDRYRYRLRVRIPTATPIPTPTENTNP